MVDFQTLVSVTMKEAKRKGLGGEGSQREFQNLMSEISTFWNQNKSTVQGWSRRQAKQWAKENVQV